MGAWREFPILWKYSLPAALSSFMIAPVLAICYFLLMQQPNGVTELAIFMVAMQYYMIALFIPAQTHHVFLTMHSESTKINAKRTNKIFRSSIALNFSSVVCIILPMIIYSPYLMNIYGRSFQMGSLTLIIMCIAVLPVALMWSTAQVMESKGMMWISFIFCFISACLLLITSYFLISLGWGALGIASAYCLAYIFRFLVMIFYLQYIGMRKILNNASEIYYK
jgi:O-antigen/teichoic acid export membrane protein